MAHFAGEKPKPMLGELSRPKSQNKVSDRDPGPPDFSPRPCPLYHAVSISCHLHPHHHHHLHTPHWFGFIRTRSRTPIGSSDRGQNPGCASRPLYSYRDETHTRDGLEGYLSGQLE